MNVLIVDDQRSARRVLSDLLSTHPDVKVVEAASLEEARAAFASTVFAVAFIDLRLSDDPRDCGGLEVLGVMRAAGACLGVMVTGHGEMADIRAAMRRGAWDYVLKDEVCEETILPMIDDVRSRRALEAEVMQLRGRSTDVSLAGLVGTSIAMQHLHEVIRRVAASSRPALVQGPTGAGKELVVRAIHQLGPDPSEPLIDLNCGALPEHLIEAQLFGHEKGAFTGAERKGVGVLAAVRKGTLFLDEIAELPLTQQSKLLRVLETRRYRPVGATEDLPFEGRVVAATHARLDERVAEGRFREDLFHRLDVLGVRVPSLEERREDIPALVSHFSVDHGRSLRFTADAVDLLCRAPWPGNVRQLRNAIDRLSVFVDEDPISAASVQKWLRQPPTTGDIALRAVATAALEKLHGANLLETVERALIEEAMQRTQGNKTAAARLLGVHRKIIERRIAPETPDEDD